MSEVIGMDTVGMGTVTITVRYFAAAKAAAETAEESRTLSAGTSVRTLVGELGADRPALATVLLRCSYLHDEVSVRHPDRTVLCDGSVLDVLPPFAGG